MTRRGWCGRRRWQHGGNGECVWLELLGRWHIGDMADGTISAPAGSCWGARAGERPASPPCADRQSDRAPANPSNRCHRPLEPGTALSAGAGAWGPADSTPHCSTFPAPAGGKELCRSWLAQPLLQPGTVTDRLATYEWRGQACAHAFSVWQPTPQRNKYICFGNTARSLCAAQAGTPLPFHMLSS